VEGVYAILPGAPDFVKKRYHPFSAPKGREIIARGEAPGKRDLKTHKP
jgi:hypothetical protein